MPDGTVIAGVPEGITQSQLLSKYQSYQSPPTTPSPFASNRGVSNPNSATTGDIAKSTVSGMESAPFWLGDTAKAAEQGLTRLAGAAYTGAGGELTPEQAEKLTNPAGPATSQEIYQKAGVPLYEPKTPFGEAANVLSNVAAAGAAGKAVSAIGNRGLDIAAERAALPENSTAAQRNESYMRGLNQNADNMKDAYGNIYNGARQMSTGVDVNEPGIQKSVNALHDSLANDPAHNGISGSSTAFKDLSAVKNSFDADGNMPLDSLTLLKRRVDDLYDPKMDAATGKIYNQLNQQLKAAINRAKMDNPEWGQAMNAGNNLFKNYQATYVDDALANKKYSLDDKADYDRVDNNEDTTGAPLSATTKERTGNIAAVDSLAQYEALMRKLPPELHDQFTQDVIANAKANQPGLAKKIGIAYNAANGNPLTAVKGLYNMMTSDKGIISALPNAAKNEVHIEDAIAANKAAAQDAFDRYKTKEPAPENSFSMIPGQTILPPQTPRLALPAPGGTEFIPSKQGPSTQAPIGAERPSSGLMRPTTQDEQIAINALRNSNDVKQATAARADQTPTSVLNTEMAQTGRAQSNMTAHDKAYKALSDLGYSNKEIMNKIGSKPELPPSSSSASVSTGMPAPSSGLSTSQGIQLRPENLTYQDELEATQPKYKKGGLIKTGKGGLK